MKTRVQKILCGAMLIMRGYALHARDIGHVPLPFYTGYIGYAHYPVDRHEPIENCLDILIQPWAGGYYRAATDAEGPNNDCNFCGIQDPCTNGRESLAQLVFGTPTFTIAQSFANSTANVPNNPFVTVTEVSPRFDYHEVGFVWGLVLEKRFGCDDNGHIGIRFVLPYRDIKVEERCDADLGTSAGSDTINEFYRQRSEDIDTNQGGSPTVASNTAWVARLDFLAALNIVGFDESGNPVPLVQFANPNQNDVITIGGQDITSGLPAASATNDFQAELAAIQSSNGSIPESVRWADVPQNGSAVIAANGTGLTNLQRGRFASDINYTPLGASTVNQSKLWIAPNVQGDTTQGLSSGLLLPGAITVKTAIDQAVNNLDATVGEFFDEVGLNFCRGENKGLGDLDVEAYINYQRCDSAWAELQFGVRFPTADTLTALDVLSPLYPALGNNGHFELRPGLVIGLEYVDWMLFKADMTYSIVLERTEYLPAAFQGATVRNIGPAITGNVSWSYFEGNFGLTFVHPCNQSLGCTIEYDAYIKQPDRIRFCGTTAADFTGVQQPLDNRVLETDSRRVAHSIRTEVFYAGYCCNIYGGFSQVVAGENIARDTDLYIGMLVSF